MNYTPHRWVIVKISYTNSEKVPYYRVFGSWSGSYLEGASWKINSGIKGITIADDYFIVSGISGSVYNLNRHTEGSLTGYTSEVLQSYLDAKHDLLTLSVVRMEDILEEFT